MADLLLELFSEEIPARMQAKAEAAEAEQESAQLAADMAAAILDCINAIMAQYGDAPAPAAEPASPHPRHRRRSETAAP